MRFKQYFEEKWVRGLPGGHPDSRKNMLTHMAKINGHDVHVNITKGNLTNSVYVNFGVKAKNSNIDKPIYDKQKISTEDGHKILNHVHKVVSHYIKKSKPKMINFDGNTPKKRKIYKQYTNLLSKKYGAKVEHDSMGSSLYFK